VFASRDGVAVYDVHTEELFWKNNRNLVLTLGNASINAPESNYIYIRGNLRHNPNNGSVIWYNPGWHDNSPIITQKQVIFWNYHLDYSDFGQNILSVNASTGETLWSYDVKASVFQPTHHNDLLLFGSVKGYFYTLNLTEGSLIWRTHVDTNHLLLNNTSSDASPVYVDSQNQRVYWGFITEQNDESQGYLCCLDISTGNVIWAEPFQTEGSTDVGGLASLKNTIFFTGNNHLWTFNKATGNLTDTKSFNHYILPPVEADNKVFIATDLFLFAYE
jgi:outer membrane protein assembly factor BamB